jgi:RNA polymerase sigma-70 factor (ECF subfamily)
LKPKQAGTLVANKAFRLSNQLDARAFEFVYRSYVGFVRNICLRMLRDPIEAEDATQDVFVCVLRKMNTFRGESAFSSWLYRLTTNSVLMRFRRNKGTWVPLEKSIEGDTASCNEIAALDLHLSGLLDRIDLESAIGVLPKGYKTALVLHDIQGYDHREIAKMHGNSIGSSKSQLHKARLRLRKLLAGRPKKPGSKMQYLPIGSN